MLKQSFYSVPTRFQRQSKIMQRRSFIIGAATLTALTVAGPVRSSEGKTKMNNLVKWDKTFPQNDKVEHKKVSFFTRFGTTCIALKAFQANFRLSPYAVRSVQVNYRRLTAAASFGRTPNSNGFRSP